MPTPDFRFKQFTIRHDRSAMKVGTDGVLLGAWATRNTSCRMKVRCLDVGTGSGLIALMLAQRFPCAEVVGIDIDEESVKQARENVEASPFAERVSIEMKDFNNIDYCSRQFDIIISNPPFYQETSVGCNAARGAARHTDSLSFERLVENSSSLLSDEGFFSVIIPYSAANRFISICAYNRLYLYNRLDVSSTQKKPPIRVLLSFTKRATEDVTHGNLTLHDADGHRSEAYTEMTKDFYL